MNDMSANPNYFELRPARARLMSSLPRRVMTAAGRPISAAPSLGNSTINPDAEAAKLYVG
jgi:hypothetical protein